MMLTALRLHERPIDSDDSIAFEFLEGFRKREEPRARLLVETDFAEICPTLCRSHSHDAIVFQERLKMPIRLRFLPQGVDLGFPAFLDDNGESCGFNFEELHEKKSARELRQRGSDYRCCIPALAGFVSPQSIAPDGTKLCAQEGARAIGFSGAVRRTACSP